MLQVQMKGLCINFLVGNDWGLLPMMMMVVGRKVQKVKVRLNWRYNKWEEKLRKRQLMRA